jgi:hypothetical protein
MFTSYAMNGMGALKKQGGFNRPWTFTMSF